MFHFAHKFGAIVMAFVLLGLVSISENSRDLESQDLTAQKSFDIDKLGISPMFFTQNVGQVSNENVFYYGDLNGMQIGFAESMVVLKIEEKSNTPSFEVSGRDRRRTHMNSEQVDTPSRGVLVRIAFRGSNSVLPEAREELPHYSNYFLGSDSAEWRTQVRNYQEIVYQDLYHGVDLVYRIEDGMAKYEFRVEAGVDLDTIEAVYEGVEGLALDANSNLVIHTVLGDLLEPVPFSYQGAGEETSCRFDLLSHHSYGFECEEWDGSEPLVIDPLIYSTFIGGGFNDDGYSMKVDSAGFVYIAGITYSSDFPPTPGAFDIIQNGNGDVFILKLNETGSGLIYSTFIGGTNADGGNSIAIDSFGNAYVTGVTYSPDFPTTPGCFDDHYELATRDAFVTKLNASGSGLLYSTFLGGGPMDEGFSISVDSMGNAYVAGETYSDTFPVTPGAFDTTHNGAYDVFVTKFNSTGNGLIYSTFVGGSWSEQAVAMDVDPSGNAYVTGITVSADFYVTAGAFDTSYNDNVDAFAFKLNASGSSVIYSTFLGGMSYEEGFSIVVDSAGNAYVTGTTQSMDFPTTPGSYKPFFDSGDAYVTKLNVSGDRILNSTFLGGSGADYGGFITLDDLGYVYIAGLTMGGFPVTPGAFDTSYNGGLYDGFLAEMNANLTDLVYSTFIGGAGDWDAVYSIGFDSGGYVYLCGATISADFPTTPGAFDISHNGNNDAFVSKLSLRFEITVDTFPSGLQVEIDGNPLSAPASFWCDPDSNHSLFAPSPQMIGPTPYYFSNWSDGGAQFHNFTCNSPVTYIASFNGNYPVTIDTNPTGMQVIVDGLTYMAPYNTRWNETEFHTINVTSPVPVNADTRWAWQSWSDGGQQNHTVNITGPTNFTALFLLEYRITVDTIPATEPVIVDFVQVTAPVVFWWTENSTHNLEALPDIPWTPGSRLAFAGWSDLGAPNHTYKVEGPDTVVATYGLLQHKVTIDTDPSGLGYEVDSVLHNVQMSFWWNDSEPHILNVSTIVPGPPSTWYEFVMWSDGNTNTNRILAPTAPVNLTAIFDLYYSVTITTDPVGLEVLVDAIPYTSPVIFGWLDGSAHWINTISPQQSLPGTQYVFDRWSNLGPMNQPVSIGGPVNFTAYFITQHLVTVDAGSMDVIVDGVIHPSPYSAWWNESENHETNVSSPFPVGPNTRLVFSSWSDGGAQWHTVNVTSPTTFFADSTLEYLVTMETTPSGLLIEVNGSSYSANYSFWCPADSPFTLHTPSPQVVGSTRYLFSSWSDSGSQTHVVNCDAPKFLTAYFDTEYLMTIETSPVDLEVVANGSTVSAPYPYWCPAGSVLSLDLVSPQVFGQSRYLFTNWSDGGSQSRLITCLGPGTYVANFVRQHSVTVDGGPSEVIIDGVTFTSPYVAWWNESEIHEIEVASTYYASSDTRYIWRFWSDGGPRIHDVAISSPSSFTASFFEEFLIEIETDPSGREIWIDDVYFAGPISYWWRLGSIHWLNTTEVQQASPDTRYSFSSWSSSGSMNHSVTITSPAVLVASFDVEYRIEVNTSPVGLIVLVDNSWVNTPAFFWWEVSSIHNLTVNATQSGLLFESWTDGALISRIVTISEPTTYVANFGQSSELIVTVIPSSTQGESPLTVQFDVDASGGISPYEYSWDFGDGAVANEEDVVHIFSESGLYEVRLVVVDSSSPSKNVTKIIHVAVESPESGGDLLGSLVWVVVIAIIVVLVIVAMLLWRRKRSEPDEDGEKSTDGEATSEDEVEN